MAKKTAATTQAAPSTTADNPLADSLARITGEEALSTDTGQTPIGYDPDQLFRQPEADVINITGDPGTGATTAETWSHDIALENLKRSQLEFEYEQQQNELANALREAEATRAETSLALQQAEASRAAGLYPTQLASAQQQLASTQQQMELAKAAEQRAAVKFQADNLGLTPEGMAKMYAQQANYGNFLGGLNQVSTPKTQAAYANTGWASYKPGVGYEIPGANVGGTTGYSPGYVGTSGGNAYYQPYGSGMSRSMGQVGTAEYSKNMAALNPANQYSGGMAKPSYMWV